MAAFVCPRCQRANPVEAAYCHFDGSALRAASGPSRQTSTIFPQEFVFPSTRRCRNFDDLVQGCQYEWEDARDLLRQGRFGQFLASIGRMDLLALAQEAQAQPDPDIGLHNFVAGLPAVQVQGPRLDLNPRRLTFGPLRPGETRQVKVTVSNGGKGLLQGKVSVAEGGQWLRLEQVNGHQQCAIKTAREQPITLRLETSGLTGPQTYSARLTVITNGGIAEVPIRLDISSMPFARAPFQGSTTPRELAEKMRAQPKAAVPLLESGEVSRWFSANGWTYPVDGAPAKGVAAVQQFFEGMGLSKPPPLQLSETEIRLFCRPPEVIQRQVTLSTSVKKWVYAQIDSEAPWLRIITPMVSGPQQAVVAFEIDSTLLDARFSRETTMRILANAGQKLSVRVCAEVERSHAPVTRRLLKPILAGLLLAVLYRLLLGVPVDLIARVLAAPTSATLPAGSFGTWLEAPPADSGFVRSFVMSTWWIGAILGGGLLWRRGQRVSDLLCGVIAGGVAGLLGSATVACLEPTLDWSARALWRGLQPLATSEGLRNAVWLWTPSWILLAAACWGLAGGLIGLALQLTGKQGLSLLGRIARPWSWTFGAVGLRRISAFFLMP
ncbi:MAG TPA: hypothetical protein VGG61_07895 [Gemmataceae bacterium]